MTDEVLKATVNGWYHFFENTKILDYSKPLFVSTIAQHYYSLGYWAGYWAGQWNYYNYVCNWLHSTGNTKSTGQTQSKPFKRGHRKKMFSSIEVQNIKDLKLKGFSNCKIAEIYHCSEKTIRNYLK